MSRETWKCGEVVACDVGRLCVLRPGHAEPHACEQHPGGDCGLVWQSPYAPEDHCEIHCHPQCPAGEAVRDWTGKQVATLPHVGKFRQETWEDSCGGCPICLRQASEAVGRFLAETPLGREMAAIRQRVPLDNPP
jgi:hypothetical protein